MLLCEMANVRRPPDHSLDVCFSKQSIPARVLRRRTERTCVFHWLPLPRPVVFPRQDAPVSNIYDMISVGYGRRVVNSGQHHSLAHPSRSEVVAAVAKIVIGT